MVSMAWSILPTFAIVTTAVYYQTRPGVTRWRTKCGLIAGCEGHKLKSIKTMVDLIKLAHDAPGTIIAVPVGDLVKANIWLVEKALADLERGIEAKREIVYYTREQVMAKLNVVPSTLWRWQKRGYLVPVKVGGENRYRSTDIDRILEG